MTTSSISLLDELIAQTRSSRLDILLADFTNKFNKLWAFSLPDFFKESLDIRFTPRVINKVTHYTWTQGSRFDFREGYIIYDTQSAYSRWDEALHQVKSAFQITKASPAIPATNDPVKWTKRPDDETIKKHIASFGQNYVSHVEETTKKCEYILRVQTKRFAGYLEVNILTPNFDCSSLVVSDSLPVSQDNFVRWLISGVNPYTKRQP